MNKKEDDLYKIFPQNNGDSFENEIVNILNRRVFHYVGDNKDSKILKELEDNVKHFSNNEITFSIAKNQLSNLNKLDELLPEKINLINTAVKILKNINFNELDSSSQKNLRLDKSISRGEDIDWLSMILISMVQKFNIFVSELNKNVKNAEIYETIVEQYRTTIKQLLAQILEFTKNTENSNFLSDISSLGNAVLKWNEKGDSISKILENNSYIKTLSQKELLENFLEVKTYEELNKAYNVNLYNSKMPPEKFESYWDLQIDEKKRTEIILARAVKHSGGTAESDIKIEVYTFSPEENKWEKNNNDFWIECKLGEAQLASPRLQLATEGVQLFFSKPADEKQSSSSSLGNLWVFDPERSKLNFKSVKMGGGLTAKSWGEDPVFNWGYIPTDKSSPSISADTFYNIILSPSKNPILCKKIDDEFGDWLKNFYISLGEVIAEQILNKNTPFLKGSVSTMVPVHQKGTKERIMTPVSSRELSEWATINPITFDEQKNEYNLIITCNNIFSDSESATHAKANPNIKFIEHSVFSAAVENAKRKGLFSDQYLMKFDDGSTSLDMSGGKGGSILIKLLTDYWAFGKKEPVQYVALGDEASGGYKINLISIDKDFQPLFDNDLEDINSLFENCYIKFRFSIRSKKYEILPEFKFNKRSLRGMNISSLKLNDKQKFEQTLDAVLH